MSLAALAIDIAILFVVVEAAWFATGGASAIGGGRGVLLANAAAGLGLLLAVRAAVNDSGDALLLASLAGALVAHVIELGMRRQTAVGGRNAS